MAEELTYRMMTTSDVEAVPIDCQGTSDEVRARIDDLGSSAVLVFDGDQHVGQLGFRRYEPGVRSPSGVMDPLYWGDLADAPALELPRSTLNVFCYHVGQLEVGAARDARYQRRGIGLRLLDELLGWAEGAGFDAIVAKAVPPYRPIAVFMGGHPAAAYADRGFDVVAQWPDDDLRAALDRMLRGDFGDETRAAIRSLVDQHFDLDAASEVAMCVRRFA